MSFIGLAPGNAVLALQITPASAISVIVFLQTVLTNFYFKRNFDEKCLIMK